MILPSLFLFISLLLIKGDTKPFHIEFGGELRDSCGSIVTTNDGDIFIFGESTSFNHFGGSQMADLWLLKLNSEGVIVSSIMFGTPQDDKMLLGNTGGILSDGSILFFSFIPENTYEMDPTITKISVNDKFNSTSVEWSYIYDYDGFSDALTNSGIITSDDEVYIVGGCCSLKLGVISRFTKNGDLEDTLLMGNTLTKDCIKDVVDIENEELVVVGESQSGNTINRLTVCKILKDLSNFIWCSYSDYSHAIAVRNTDNGILVIGGNGQDCAFFYLFRKVDGSLIQKRAFCFASGAMELVQHDVLMDTLNSFIVVMSSTVGGVFARISLDNFDVIKVMIGKKNVVTSLFSVAFSQRGNMSSNIILVGERIQEGSYETMDCVVIKLDKDLRSCRLEEVKEYKLMDAPDVKSFEWEILESKTYPSVASNYVISDFPEPILNVTCFSCYGIDNDENLVCNAHGKCLSHNNCSCTEKYYGEDCNKFSCFGISRSEIGKACSPVNSSLFTGVCVAVDYCYCNPGYFKHENFLCDTWYCGHELYSSSSVCSSHGDCDASQRCICDNGYVGELCASHTCDGIDFLDETTACQGNGDCIAMDHCECRVGYIGKFCDVNIIYYTVLIPLVILVICFCTCFVFLVVCVCGFCVCCILHCLCCVFLCSCCSLCCFVCRQRFGMRKFIKLRNFDMLLKEQELEQDTSIAHIRINKNLFTIIYDEIKIISILGEGGSNSIVFKSLWNGQLAAFKCFKTRNVCSDQNNYDCFEREVEVISSLHHPNIIRFYGCSIQSPRIGILMEYCENGTIFEFFVAKRVENSEGYSLKNKVRLCREITSSMEYLHSRNVIHRDLKDENILIDKWEACKLMDFGLSKIVTDMSLSKTKRIGTNIYMAPEIIRSGKYTEQCDVFSFAILMVVLFSENQEPYGPDARNVEFRVSEDEHYRPDLQDIEKSLDSRFHFILEIIQKCWKDDALERLTFVELGEVFDLKMHDVYASRDVDEFREKQKSGLEEVDESLLDTSNSNGSGGLYSEIMIMNFEIDKNIEKSKLVEYRDFLKYKISLFENSVSSMEVESEEVLENRKKLIQSISSLEKGYEELSSKLEVLKEKGSSNINI